MNKTEQRIRQQLADNPVILYMKGIPDNPECGFSARAVAALKATGIPFTYVNVMAAPFIRERLPKVSRWPTFPQLFVNGELIGGCDIIEAMAQDGSLLPALRKANPPTPAENDGGGITHDEVKASILAAFPDAAIMIEGEGCDLLITVVSSKFAGQSLLQQQQGVMSTLASELDSGRLHALSVRTFTPEQWQEKLSAAPGNGLLQIQL